MSTVLQAALDYAAQGRRVHPCRPEDKRPLTRWGTAATTEPWVIIEYWNRWPDALLAVCTGDGLVVVDVDPRNGGLRLEDCFDTLTASTRSGGWHHWYTTTEAIGNRVGLIDGVDIRGAGGYVIAPPSPGWTWANDAPLQPVPAYLLAALDVKDRHRTGFMQAEAGSVGDGRRHDYMVRFAGWAIRALEPLTPGELADLCWEEYARACSPADAPHRNIERIAYSIWRADQRA